MDLSVCINIMFHPQQQQQAPVVWLALQFKRNEHCFVRPQFSASSPRLPCPTAVDWESPRLFSLLITRGAVFDSLTVVGRQRRLAGRVNVKETPQQWERQPR